MICTLALPFLPTPRLQLPSASFNDIAALLSLGVMFHGPPPLAWLEEACGIMEQKVGCMGLGQLGYIGQLGLGQLGLNLVESFMRLACLPLRHPCPHTPLQFMQPSGGLGLRMYASLMDALRLMSYEPRRPVVEALEKIGRRLLKVRGERGLPECLPEYRRCTEFVRRVPLFSVRGGVTPEQAHHLTKAVPLRRFRCSHRRRRWTWL